MIDFIVQFYKRTKKNIFKHMLLRISLAVIFVSAIARILLYIEPKPNLAAENGNFSDFINYIFVEEGVIFFLVIVLCLLLIDLYTQKKNKAR